MNNGWVLIGIYVGMMSVVGAGAWWLQRRHR